MRHDPLEEFRERFRLAELSLKEYRYWIVSLRPQQPTVAALVLSLRRSCSSLGGMEASETEELATVLAEIEAVLAATYAPSRINYLALMMVDAQVHFHVLPRYEEERSVRGRAFSDAAWPGPPDVTATLPFETIDLDELAATLRAALR